MIKTTIEWHRTSDQLPDDDLLVIAADSDGNTFAAFVDGDAWRYADAMYSTPTPEFWAHFPAGPELPRWRAGVEPVSEPVPQTCKPALQVAARPLTDEEADALAYEIVKGGKSVQWLVRAIERAHGITGGNDD